MIEPDEHTPNAVSETSTDSTDVLYGIVEGVGVLADDSEEQKQEQE